MFSFVKMKVKQAQLYKKNKPNQNATTIHHIQLHGGKRKTNKNTQTVRKNSYKARTKQEKQQPVVTFSKKGPGVTAKLLLHS